MVRTTCMEMSLALAFNQLSFFAYFVSHELTV